MTPAAILRGARDLLKRDGWIQGASRTPFGVCPGRAIYEMNGSIGPSLSCAHYLALFTGDPSLVRWNDVPGRTWEQVLAAFEDAIEAAERDAFDWAARAARLEQ